MILMTAITSAITTTQQKPSLAPWDNPSAVQCHGTPERDSTYVLCQRRYSSKEDKNHSRTLLFIVRNGFRQVTASTQLGSFKDAAPVFPLYKSENGTHAEWDFQNNENPVISKQ